MIPTFNCARYLGETLESVLCQDPGPEVMQIEVIDDHSTKDDPESIVRKLGKGRVGFHRQPQNVGHTRNFETCLQRSRGHLVHLLHGDDAVRPGFYTSLGRVFAEHPQVGAAFCRNLVIDEKGNWTGLSPLETSKSGVLVDLVERLAVRQCIQTPAMAVRRAIYEILGMFDKRLSWTEDWEMWARIAGSYPVWHEVAPLALYRIHADSNTGRYKRTGENIRDLHRLFSLVENYVPNGRGRSLARRGRKRYSLSGFRTAQIMSRSGDVSGAVAQTIEGFRLCPTFRVGLHLLGVAVGVTTYNIKRLLLSK
jgi:glycosyltransferase involved in cell wall biosynthesis